jgi:mitochondrial ATPase complex subunit ATP10
MIAVKKYSSKTIFNMNSITQVFTASYQVRAQPAFRCICTSTTVHKLWQLISLSRFTSNHPSNTYCYNWNRFFSSNRHEFEKNSDYDHRHNGVIVHPESIAGKILPGNVVLRTTRQGLQKLRITEMEYGNFWMIKDLKQTGEKPILANETLIDEHDAKLFPEIKGARNLSGVSVNFPGHCVRKNRSRDAEAQCTLLAISFRDFGFQQLPSWIDPFAAAFGSNDRVEVLKINVANGWFDRYFLRPIITALTKRNTDPKDYDKTFLFYGNTEQLCDAMRMRNVLAGYVFLLDGLGRVRFAGSGVATEAEASRLISLTKKLTPLIVPRRQYGGAYNATRKVPSNNFVRKKRF